MSDEIKEKQFDILNRREVLKGLATVPVSVSYTHLTLPTILLV